MTKLPHFTSYLRILVSLLLVTSAQATPTDAIVWSCSRSEPKQATFEGIKTFRIENLTTKDSDTISITLMDLYGAYGGEVIRMGKKQLSVCSLPPKDPLQITAMAILGYSPEDFLRTSQSAKGTLVFIPSIYQMQKCLHENHPAIGFLKNVVENESVAPCF